MTEFPDARLVLVGARAAALHDPLAPSAEDLLLEKEELESQGLNEPPTPKRRLELSRPQIHAALERLPPKEAEALIAYFAGGQRQREIAARMGISQPSIHGRIHLAIRKLQWITGPGAAFTPEDIERDLRRALPADQVRALSIYWRTTSVRAVGVAMGFRSYTPAWNLLRRAMAGLQGKYRRGFAELLRSGQHLLKHVAVRFSGVEDFIYRRCALLPSARVARDSLVASYERHARAACSPADPAALARALESRGVRTGTIRVAWARSPVRGFLGVRLQSESRIIEERAPIG